MRQFIFLVLTGICSPVYSQFFRGKVVDEKTDEVLEYANIGVVGKNLGGISLRTGEFNIDLSGAVKNDVVRVSYIGYESFSVLVDTLDFTKYHIIKLAAKSYELNPIVISEGRNS